MKLSYADIVEKIIHKERFDFGRYGDGELECMFHKRGRPMNSDLHKYYPDLGEALIKVWEDGMKGQDYFLGMQNLGYRQNTEKVEEYKSKYSLEFVNSDLMHKASMRGKIGLLKEALEKREVIWVAPKHLKNIGFGEFIHVPYQNAWLEKDRVIEEIAAKIDEGKVIVYCCGMMAAVLIHSVHELAKELNVTQLDAGSAFDPYCGVNSRGYHFELSGADKNQSSTYFKQRGR